MGGGRGWTPSPLNVGGEDKLILRINQVLDWSSGYSSPAEMLTRTSVSAYITIKR